MKKETEANHEIFDKNETIDDYVTVKMQNNISQSLKYIFKKD